MRERFAAWQDMVSLVLTLTSGLMAIGFQTLRGDFSLAWWIPNLSLMLFPVPGIVYLTRRPAPQS